MGSWRMKVLTYDSNESNHVRRSVLMKNTSIFALAAGMGSLVLATSASADLGLSVELVRTGAEGQTYRMYVSGMEDDSRIDAVFGNASNSLTISAGDGLSFYQNGLGGNTSTSINSAFFPLAPSVEWDSYVTIGTLYQNGAPFGGNALSDIGINWSSFAAGGALTTDNGSWYVTPDDAQGGEMDNMVLIGQFTIAGGSGDVADDFGAVSVNVQGKYADGTTFQGLNLAIPAPGALALLGVAGLVSRRRRK